MSDELKLVDLVNEFGGVVTLTHSSTTNRFEAVWSNDVSTTTGTGDSEQSALRNLRLAILMLNAARGQ